MTTITTTYTRTHSLIGFANPYLNCDTCNDPVRYWHNPDRCGNCDAEYFNVPCGHTAGVTSVCYSWNPVDGCMCINKETHDRAE